MRSRVRGKATIGVLIITYTILGVPYYNSYIVYWPQNPILIIKAPVLLLVELALSLLAIRTFRLALAIHAWLTP